MNDEEGLPNRAYVQKIGRRASEIAADPIGNGVAGPVGMALTPSGRENLRKIFNIGGKKDAREI